MKNKKSIILLSGIILTLVLTLSISYAFFYYVGEGDEITLTSGSISIDFSEGTNYISLGNSYPKSDRMGKIDPNYYDFTISGSKGENDDILYEIQIEPEEGNTLDEKYVKVYLTDQNDKYFVPQTFLISDLPISKYTGNRVIRSSYIYDMEQSQDYRLRVWIDESYTENIKKIFNFKINVYAINDEIVALYEKLEETLAPFLLEDDGDARIVSGTKKEIDNNYVWYSGKLWRVVALNNDGTIKLITDESLTTLGWNDKTVYKDSWIYQWLNEDFLDTLYNYENIVKGDYLWNATSTTEKDKPSNTTMVHGIVGLLNTYEYVKSYGNNSFPEGYLNNVTGWWLMTPKSSSNVWMVTHQGYASEFTSTSHMFYGVRPSIVLNSHVKSYGGNGSESDPYMLVGDTKKPKKYDLLKNRISGEYLYFDDQLYRIVNIGDEGIKIVSENALKNSSNIVLKKYLSSTYLFGDSNNTQSDSYWDYYLNNTWYNGITKKYKEMMIPGVWYLGTVYSKSYKNSICSTNNTNETIKVCEKTSKIFAGYVGLGRIGEIFTSHLRGTSENSTSGAWSITPYNTNHVWRILESGYSNYYYANKGFYYAKPQIFLSSKVYITSGSGTLQDPFEIAMD